MNPGLLYNFVEFFNDNVVMMVMAGSIGSLASALAGAVLSMTDYDCALALAVAQAVVCLFLIFLLRAIGLWFYRRTEKDAVWNGVFKAILFGLPWFLRVPMVILLPVCLQDIYTSVGYDPTREMHGEALVAFAWNFAVFVLVFEALLCSAWVVRHSSDADCVDASWPTFLLQCFYLGTMSSAGKAMHFLLHIVLVALTGPFDPLSPTGSDALGILIFLVILTCACWFILASSLPNQMSNPKIEGSPFAQMHLTCQQYVAVYTWAYAVVNSAWGGIYNYVGGVLTSYTFGGILFACWMLFHLSLAVMFALTTPDRNFYDMGKDNHHKSAACLMNFWLIDFITWWIQAQVMISLDGDVKNLGKEGVLLPGDWPMIWTNAAVVLTALLVCGGVHALNYKALLHKETTKSGHKHKVFHVLCERFDKYSHFLEDHIHRPVFHARLLG